LPFPAEINPVVPQNDAGLECVICIPGVSLRAFFRCAARARHCPVVPQTTRDSNASFEYREFHSGLFSDVPQRARHCPGATWCSCRQELIWTALQHAAFLPLRWRVLQTPAFAPLFGWALQAYCHPVQNRNPGSPCGSKIISERVIEAGAPSTPSGAGRD